MSDTLQLKIGRKTFNIDDNDVIMDNGAIIQVITKKTGYGWNAYPLKMSKKLYNELRKFEFLYTDEDLKRYSIEKYHGEVTLYKFNIEKMKKCGY